MEVSQMQHSGGNLRDDKPFRVMLATLTALAYAFRLYYTRRGGEPGEKVSRTRVEPLSRWALLAFFYALMVIPGFVYVFAPHRMRWARLPLPTWLRRLGVALGIVNLLLFAWTHHALRRAWSLRLVIKEKQPLVTSGPYRWVRHPMYTSIFGSALAASLLSATWLMGLGVVGTSISIAARVGDEEALMIEEFGDQYRAYMQRTGRFLPPMRLKSS